jgi:dTDP-4-dehydrorhamnose reductase
MVKILVTGANGQLGKEFRDLESQYPNCEFLFLSREDLPIHHFELVRNVFDSFKPDFCINCAAYTAVDKAEQEKDLAYLVNAESVGVLAAVCKIHNTKFVHVSTDYVYSGTANKPYTEEDQTDPQSVYGSSKLAGEKEALLHCSDVVILRTSWVYSVHGKNFVKTMMKLMSEKETLSVVADQHGTPTWASDIADAIMKVIQHPTWHPGIYNFSNSGEISWYDFASEIKQLIHSSCEVKPIPTSAYPTPAKRPQYSVLDKIKIISTYHIELKDWKESLTKCMAILEKQ